MESAPPASLAVEGGNFPPDVDELLAILHEESNNLSDRAQKVEWSNGAWESAHQLEKLRSTIRRRIKACVVSPSHLH